MNRANGPIPLAEGRTTGPTGITGSTGRWALLRARRAARVASAWLAWQAFAAWVRPLGGVESRLRRLFGRFVGSLVRVDQLCAACDGRDLVLLGECGPVVPAGEGPSCQATAGATWCWSRCWADWHRGRPTLRRRHRR